MSVSAGERNKAIVASTNAARLTGGTRNREMQQKASRCAASETAIQLPRLCDGKVRSIRHQLSEDRYDINRRLEVAFDKLLDELFGHESRARIFTGS